jgi:hemolysin III
LKQGHSTLKNNKKRRLNYSRVDTKKEEIASSIIHGIGALLSISGLSVLLALASRQGDALRLASISVYGATLIVLYISSTIYHISLNPGVKKVFHVFDHASIYLLIAGTYTPFCLVILRGNWGWSIFGIVWGIAVLGIVFKAFFTGRFKILSTILYLVMGWIVIIALKPLLEKLPSGGFKWLALGGACYTSGVIFFAWRKLYYSHPIWHLFVLAGSIFHFFAVLFYVLPMN